MNTTTHRRLGIVGIGLLGSAVAARVLARGFEAVGYDTVPERVLALAGSGLRAAAGWPAFFSNPLKAPRSGNLISPWAW